MLFVLLLEALVRWCLYYKDSFYVRQLDFAVYLSLNMPLGALILTNYWPLLRADFDEWDKQLYIFFLITEILIIITCMEYQQI